MLFSANTLRWVSRMYAHVRGWIAFLGHHHSKCSGPSPPPPAILIDRSLKTEAHSEKGGFKGVHPLSPPKEKKCPNFWGRMRPWGLASFYSPTPSFIKIGTHSCEDNKNLTKFFLIIFTPVPVVVKHFHAKAIGSFCHSTPNHAHANNSNG